MGVEVGVERTLRLGLNAWPGVGPVRMRALDEAVGGDWLRLAHEWEAVWRAVARALEPPPPLPAVLALGEEQRRALGALGARFLLPGDDGWPIQLDPLDHPPPLLHLRGDACLLAGARPRVAVIGARACTPYGREQAARFGAGLAASGIVVASGAARGVDQCAMRGALDAGGAVIAVLGAGLDRPYPPSVAPMLEEIVARGGAVVSEFACGVEPRAGNFPRRNRVLAGLCAGVVVIQATRKSGSMNTVAWALSLGREVWALPGPVDTAASQGAHQLLREGAALAEGPLDVARGLEQSAGPQEMGRDSPVLAALDGRDRGLRDLAEALGQAEDLLLLDLLDLEMRGRVLRLSSGLYHRCGPSRSRDGARA